MADRLSKEYYSEYYSDEDAEDDDSKAPAAKAASSAAPAKQAQPQPDPAKLQQQQQSEDYYSDEYEYDEDEDAGAAPTPAPPSAKKPPEATPPMRQQQNWLNREMDTMTPGGSAQTPGSVQRRPSLADKVGTMLGAAGKPSSGGKLPGQPTPASGSIGVMWAEEARRLASSELQQFGLPNSTVAPTGSAANAGAMYVMTGDARWATATPAERLAVVSGFATNTRVTAVMMASAYVNDELATAWGAVLRTNTKLLALNLDSNTIGDAGAVELCSALQTNVTLRELRLASQARPFSAEAEERISRSVGANQTLIRIAVDLRGQGPKQRVEAALKANQERAKAAKERKAAMKAAQQQPQPQQPPPMQPPPQPPRQPPQPAKLPQQPPKQPPPATQQQEQRQRLQPQPTPQPQRQQRQQLQTKLEAAERTIPRRMEEAQNAKERRKSLAAEVAQLEREVQGLSRQATQKAAAAQAAEAGGRSFGMQQQQRGQQQPQQQQRQQPPPPPTLPPPRQQQQQRRPQQRGADGAAAAAAAATQGAQGTRRRSRAEAEARHYARRRSEAQMRVESGVDFPGGRRPSPPPPPQAAARQAQRGATTSERGGRAAAEAGGDVEPLFIPEGGGAAIGADGKPDWQLVDSEAARLRAKLESDLMNAAANTADVADTLWGHAAQLVRETALAWQAAFGTEEGLDDGEGDGDSDTFDVWDGNVHGQDWAYHTHDHFAPAGVGSGASQHRLQHGGGGSGRLHPTDRAALDIAAEDTLRGIRQRGGRAGSGVGGGGGGGGGRRGRGHDDDDDDDDVRERHKRQMLVLLDYEHMPLFSSRYAIRLSSGTWVPLERDEDMHRSVYCKLTKNLSGPHFEFVIAAGIMHLLTSRAAGPRAIEQVDVGIGEARVGILHEDNYLGAQAKICVAGGTASALEVNVGLGISTGAGVKDDSLSVKLCGTGFTLGRKVGFSLLDNEVALDLGKLLVAGHELGEEEEPETYLGAPR